MPPKIEEIILGFLPFRKVTGPGLLDSKSYATGCGANRFTILTLLLDIAGWAFISHILSTPRRGMCTSSDLKNETIDLYNFVPCWNLSLKYGNLSFFFPS